MGCIYSILNKENGKIYIGQTIQKFNKRKSKHISQLRRQEHFSNHLQNAWNKYGEDAFEFGIIERCPDEELNDNERWWVDYFNSDNPLNGYNLQSGGNSDFTVSEETRRKQSEALKGYVHSDETRKRISDAHKGMKFSKSHIENMSKSRSINHNTTGYYRVHKDKDPRYSQGFRYVYRWSDNGKKSKISSVSLERLEEKVISQGLLWCKIEELG